MSILSLFKKFLHNRKKKKELRKKILTENISYEDTAENFTKSLAHSAKIYKTLITNVHPDLFGENDKEYVTDLSARITKHKKNYNKLLMLEVEVKEFLKEN